ncbi:streptococcal hemagglutinin-like isoform X3 [Littorina saxatilis]
MAHPFEELQQAGDEQLNKNTNRNTLRSNRSAARLFREFLREKGDGSDFENFSAAKLDDALGHFYMEARTKKGEHYTKTTLMIMQSALQRHLAGPPYGRMFHFNHDQEFRFSKSCLKSAVAEVVQKGKGKTNHCLCITNEDLRKMYESELFDPDTPAGLSNKVQFDLRLHLGFTSTNAPLMTKDSFRVDLDPTSGLKYVYKAAAAKAKETGQEVERMMENCYDPQRCPVRSFEKYVTLLNPATERFWQYPRPSVNSLDKTWFRKANMGTHALARFMKTMSQRCGLSRQYTNSSIRMSKKRLITLVQYGLGSASCLTPVLALGLSPGTISQPLAASCHCKTAESTSSSPAEKGLSTVSENVQDVKSATNLTILQPVASQQALTSQAGVTQPMRLLLPLNDGNGAENPGVSAAYSASVPMICIILNNAAMERNTSVAGNSSLTPASVTAQLFLPSNCSPQTRQLSILRPSVSAAAPAITFVNKTGLSRNQVPVHSSVMTPYAANSESRKDSSAAVPLNNPTPRQGMISTTCLPVSIPVKTLPFNCSLSVTPGMNAHASSACTASIAVQLESSNSTSASLPLREIQNTTTLTSSTPRMLQTKDGSGVLSVESGTNPGSMRGLELIPHNDTPVKLTRVATTPLSVSPEPSDMLQTTTKTTSAASVTVNKPEVSSQWVYVFDTSDLPTINAASINPQLVPSKFSATPVSVSSVTVPVSSVCNALTEAVRDPANIHTLNSGSDLLMHPQGKSKSSYNPSASVEPSAEVIYIDVDETEMRNAVISEGLDVSPHARSQSDSRSVVTTRQATGTVPALTGSVLPDIILLSNGYGSESASTKTMSEGQSAEFEIEYQVYGSEEQESEMNGSEATELAGVQVKFEPDDPEFESTVGGSSVSAGLLRSFPPPGMASSQSAAQWSGNSSKVRTQLRKIIENKSVDSSTAAQNVNSVIEDLLKKNEYLLSKNDALGMKPNSRRGRVPGEVGRSREVVFPTAGQSTTFSTGPASQGRVYQSGTRRSPHREAAITMGQLLRPKSPTRRCSIPEKDKSHFTLALMESKVGEEEGEKIFRVQEHEMVCAVSSQTKFLNKDGVLVSSTDINFYWCNFCPYSTTHKSQLVQHVMDHRFHCKHCRYQSFSRADVIHHSVHNHPGFGETASVTQYCTLLSDYLRVQNPKENNLDHQRKRRGPPEDENGEQPASKVSRNNQTKSKQKVQKAFAANYEFYDVNIENLEETQEEDGAGTASQEAGSKSSSASSSVTAVTSESDQQSNLNQQQGTIISSLMSQPAHSHSSSPVPEMGHPVITQVFSASTIPPSLVPETPTQSPSQRGAAASSRSTSRPSPSPSPTPPMMSANSLGAGAMQQMRTNLYWSCGYCTFTSKSQSGIKDHSMRQHSGKPHRYVALIKPEEGPATGKSGSGDDSNSSMDQNVEIDVAEENQVQDGQDAAQSEDSFADHSQSEEPPVLVKQEPVDQEESIVPIKVRFPTPRIQSKDSTSLKCYHCSYNSRILGPLRNHILNRHKGKCLIGLGGMNSRVFMCTRSDCTFRSSSGQTFLNHSHQCTPWLQPDATEAPKEPHLLDCLKATTSIAEESQSLSPPPAASIPTTSASTAAAASSKVVPV